MTADNLDQWLENLPLDEPVDIDGDMVFLRMHSHGAELGVYLQPECTGTVINEAMHSAFQSALQFSAGLAVEGEDLLLTQWLPQVESWPQAAEALEELLNQTSLLRELMSASAPPSGDSRQHNEDRMRKLLAGGMS